MHLLYAHIILVLPLPLLFFGLQLSISVDLTLAPFYVHFQNVPSIYLVLVLVLVETPFVSVTPPHLLNTWRLVGFHKLTISL